MEQLELFPTIYNISSDKIHVTTKTPSISFGNGISESMIWSVLRAMAKKQIRITDYEGNELEVSMY